ncbi:auxin-responsive protein SAUR32-like, partial [Ananas comosus]|uniref:Auxin-responsive protein SAUR32-like n=1 Tax=Ananas comosus TaxID=4615 RepID=A0A6P5GXS3_ANACO
MGSRHRRRHSPAPAPPSAARRGWVAIRVGAEGEERRRFVVPVGFVNHPLFAGLLREAEEEFGFQHDGALTLPCRLDHFRRVHAAIHRHLPLP